MIAILNQTIEETKLAKDAHIVLADSAQLELDKKIQIAQKMYRWVWLFRKRMIFSSFSFQQNLYKTA